MHPLFELSAGHLAAQRDWSAAADELERRVGRSVGMLQLDLGYQGFADLVLREHGDLAKPLDVTPCVCGCGRAGTVPCNGWRAEGACLEAALEACTGVRAELPMTTP